MNPPSVLITPDEERRYAELQSMTVDAARSGDGELLTTLLRAGMPVNLADARGNTLLMLASYHGHAALVQALLEAGAEADRRNDRGQTPLHGAAFKGDLLVVRLLVEGGADVMADSGGGMRPVDWARLFGRTAVESYLRVRTHPGARRTWALRAVDLVVGVRRVWHRLARRPAPANG